MKNVLRPEIGVELLLVRGDDVLLGLRQGSHGEGEYSGPGGHVEIGQTLLEALLEELDQECGLDLRIKNLEKLCVSEVMRYQPKQYLDVGFVADWVSGEPVVMEPDKLKHWKWCPMNELPSPLMEGFANYVTAYKTGQVFFEPDQ